MGSVTRIALIGEAWGEEEARARAPFVGSSGYLLNQLLEEAGIVRADCYLTNVFNLRPEPTNDIENLCGPKSEGIPGREPLRQGKYFRAEFLPEVQRLEKELEDLRPNICVALGGTAAWALLGRATVKKVRGAVGVGLHGLKCLATYHPAAVLRQWELRPVTVLDLIKAERESHFPEVRRPAREIWIEPTLDDMERFYDLYLRDAKEISFDIETIGSQITCIGFSSSVSAALVIPFLDRRAPGNCYWREAALERMAWLFIKRVLSLPCRKVAQNGLYDVHFLWRRYGIEVRNFADDTMLLHHALQPESPKGLDFLGSVYTQEASWKLMRNKTETIKREA